DRGARRHQSGRWQGAGRGCAAGARGADAAVFGHADHARVELHDRCRVGRVPGSGDCNQLSEVAEMNIVAGDTVLHLQPDVFPGGGQRLIADSGAFSVTAFRYPSSVEGLRIANARGHVVVLPFLGQMIWDAVFEGRRLTMGNVFPYPRNGASILETYGAFAYHAGVLRNGTPGPQDTHPLHGEMPVTRMDSAHLRFGHDTQGSFVEVGGHA